jgi:hypothetical protein
LKNDPYFRPEGISSRLTLAITVIAAFIYGLQWYQMRKSMENDDRAWIKIAIGQVIPPNTNYPIIIPLTFTNIGKTPARKIQIKTAVKIVLNHESFDFAYDHAIGVTTGVMFPDQPNPAVDARTVYSHGARNLTTDELSDLTNGQAFVITYSSVTYLDVFGNPHWTLPLLQQSAERQFPEYTAVYCVALAAPASGLVRCRGLPIPLFNWDGDS